MARTFATDVRRRLGVAGVLLAGSLAGCGSASRSELPPPATPATAPATGGVQPAGELIAPDSKPLAVDLDVDTTSSTFRDGTLTATVHARDRVLTITDPAGETLSSEPAGVGPTHVSCYPTGPCFVVDTQGDALLVFRVGEGGTQLRLTRRVYVAGAPYGIALDPARKRLWVTLSGRNEVVELPAHGRPHLLARLPTLQQPDAIAVDEPSGDVFIASQDRSQLQRIPDPASRTG